MAKIAKPKKREASVHSRSFRRNVTPPTEVTKSAKSTVDEPESWLYNAQNAGVHKRGKAKKGATRQQHLRRVKALERADRNSAVLENKVAKSRLQSKKILARAKDWEELNEELNEELPVKSNDTSKAVQPAAHAPTVMEGIEELPPVETVAEAIPTTTDTIVEVNEKAVVLHPQEVPDERIATGLEELGVIT